MIDVYLLLYKENGKFHKAYTTREEATKRKKIEEAKLNKSMDDSEVLYPIALVVRKVTAKEGETT